MMRMISHPILFRDIMVKALTQRIKTQSRRTDHSWLKVKKGHLLWVRETFSKGYVPFGGMEYIYRANSSKPHKGKWTPSIHMPKDACRIFLEATEDARLERLHDMTEKDALAEGIAIRMSRNTCTIYDGIYKGEFSQLWDEFPRAPGFKWADNPEIVALRFNVAKIIGERDAR